MDKYLHSKWTTINKISGWRHFEVRSVFKNQQKIELFPVCDKNINIIVCINEIKDRKKWLPGWKEIL